MSSFRVLPPEIFGEIFSYLSQFDLIHLRQIDRFFRDLSILEGTIRQLRDFLLAPVNFWKFYDGFSKNGELIKYYGMVIINSAEPVNYMKEIELAEPFGENGSFGEFLFAHGAKKGDYVYISDFGKFGQIKSKDKFKVFANPWIVRMTRNIDLRIFHYWRYVKNYGLLNPQRSYWSPFTLRQPTFYVPQLKFHLEFKIRDYLNEIPEDDLPCDTRKYLFDLHKNSPFYLKYTIPDFKGFPLNYGLCWSKN